MNIPGYDNWKLATPWDDCHEVGIENGQQCNRIAEPDEDAPRGYRPKPCKGEMVEHGGQHGAVICDTCGEVA